MSYLIHLVEREKAEIGIFLSLEPPTKEMQTEAISAGFYESTGWQKKYPKIQIITISDILQAGRDIDIPPNFSTFKKASKELTTHGEQSDIWHT